MNNIKAVFFLIKNFFFAFKKLYFDIFYVPFDINQPLPKKSLNYLYDLFSKLDHLKINYYVTDGTILGIYRDNKLIPHDTDIDIALIDNKKLFNLFCSMIKSGWIPMRILIKDFHIYQLIFYKDRVVLDFCNWKRKLDKIIFLAPEVDGIRLQDIKYYKPTIFSLNGHNYLSHSKIDEWLEIHYGKDWKIPKSSKGDWREDTKDIIKN